MDISNSTFSGNSASELGGAFFGGSPSGSITGSTFVNNSATSAGGLYLDYATLTLSNDTLTGNIANNNGNNGDAITSTGVCDVTLDSCTVAYNGPPGGNSITNDSTSQNSCQMYDSIVAGNTTWNVTSLGYNLVSDTSNLTPLSTDVVPPQITLFANTSGNATTGGSLEDGTYWYRVSAVTPEGVLTSDEYSDTVTGNGIYNSVTINWSAVAGASYYLVCGRTEGAEQLIATVNGSATSYLDYGSTTPSGAPVLPVAPLASNGGSTETMALVAGSPALDDGDPNFTPPPTTDQRGLPRCSTTALTSAAYESQSLLLLPPPPTTLTVTTLTDTVPGSLRRRTRSGPAGRHDRLCLRSEWHAAAYRWATRGRRPT